jgi:dienelactone hydrolase
VVLAFGALVVVWAATAATPELTDSAPPANAPDTAFTWHTIAMPGGASSVVGVVRAPDGTGRDHPAILLVSGTEGLNTDYLQFAREVAARGFDVAVGCWFRTEGPTGAGTMGIACPQAPKFKGVSDAAVADLEALVQGARRALGDPFSLALVGFSRGGGIAMLRASGGAPGPVVSISGMLEGTTAWGNLADEVNVVDRASGVRAPVLLLHGQDDEMVPLSQAEHMAGALQAAGADVQTHWYPAAGHGLAQVPAIRADLVQRIAEWLPTTFSPAASRRAAG